MISAHLNPRESHVHLERLSKVLRADGANLAIIEAESFEARVDLECLGEVP